MAFHISSVTPKIIRKSIREYGQEGVKGSSAITGNTKNYQNDKLINEYVLSGYRHTSESIQSGLRRFVNVSDETGNVYYHLLGALMSAVLPSVAEIFPMGVTARDTVIDRFGIPCAEQLWVRNSLAGRDLAYLSISRIT